MTRNAHGSSWSRGRPGRRLHRSSGGGGGADGASDASDLPVYLVIFSVGFVLWLGAAKAAFRRTPWGLLLAFAAAAEAISGGIDYWAIHDLKSGWHGI